MEPFTAAPHHEIFELLLRMGVLLLVARVLGELATRLRQPSVVGEILAGIVLGPSILAGIFPGLGDLIVPEPGLEGYLLEEISLLGALFLLLITGLETDLALIRRHARTAIGVSFGGISVTFATGFLLGQWMPAYMLVDPAQRLVFALFVATAMSISAIPVIAKVLMDLNLMRRDVGQTIIAAGMSDDTVGWTLLSIVAGLAAGGLVTFWSVGVAVGRVLIFMLVSFTVVFWVVRRMLDVVEDRWQSTEGTLSFVIVLMLLWAALSQLLGLEAVLGAFVMGIILGQMPRLPEAVHHKLMAVALGIFTPIFFATAGLKVDVRSLVQPHLLLITLLVIAVATVGKVIGTYAGARLVGRRDHWTALSFGAGLNARGAMEIIIATIGLELGILGQEMFSIIVVMAMATSLLAPPALRWTLARVKPGEEERQRLEREAREAESVIARVQRVLVPVRTRPHAAAVHGLESYLVDRLSRGERKLFVTLLTISSREERTAANAFLEEVAAGFHDAVVTRRIVEGGDPADVILAEARRGYDLLVVGATETPVSGDSLFHPVIDQLVRLSPCPTVVARRGAEPGDWPPRRILVPTNGSQASKRAAELAFRVAAPDDLIIGLHVVPLQDSPYHVARQSSVEQRQRQAGEQILEGLRAAADSAGVPLRAEVRTGGKVDDVILQVAEEEEIDLILIGTDVRPASTRLFFGPKVEHTLEAAPCPVLVLNGG